MNRITPEQVLQAYEETGLKPEQDCFYLDNGDSRCGCGLTAVLVAKYPKILTDLPESWGIDDFIQRNVFQLFDFSEYYTEGFISGFDDGGKPTLNADQLYKTGYNDGRAAWEAVKHLAGGE